MLEFIEGKIISKQPPATVIQAGNMGFKLWVSQQTWQNLPGAGETVLIYTYLHVREEELSLYGFSRIEEREFFTLLLQVSGVGPKLALGILSAYPLQTLKQAILFGDTAALTSISGIGKKTAQRLILELKDKLSKDSEALKSDNSQSTSDQDPRYEDQRSQAVAALMALGYSSSEAYQALPATADTIDLTVEALIRLGLTKLAKF